MQRSHAAATSLIVRVGGLALAMVVLALCASGGWVITRSEIVDEQVERLARLAGPMVPTSPVAGGVAARYPVIERILLREQVETPSGRVVPTTEMWLLHALSFERTAAMLGLWAASGVLIAVGAVRWAWPQVNPGNASPKRFAVFVLSVAVRTGAVGTVLVCLCMPIVSFWGTVVYERAEMTGRQAWILDTPMTRAAIGVGLALAWAMIGVRIACGRINALLGRELAGVRDDRPTGERGGRVTLVCLACGYRPNVESSRCPECGDVLGPPERVAWIWPRGFGAPTRAKRGRVRALLVVLAVGLACAPFVCGVARGLWERVFS